MWAYAILRYRLIDVDIIFQQGLVYTMGHAVGSRDLLRIAVFRWQVGELSGGALVALLLIAAFVFQPIRNGCRNCLDRHYLYKDRIDYG